MPFKSKAQAKYMFWAKPKLAKEFAEKTLSIKNLPKKLGSTHDKLFEKQIKRKK